MGDELNLIETNESPEPSYDVSTDMVHDPDLNDGKGGKRDPFVHETVKAAFMAQKAARDPIEKYRQAAEKNGRSLEEVLDKVHEFENLGDLVDKHRWLDRYHGADSQLTATHLYNGTTATQAAQQVAEAEAARSVQAWEQSRPDLPVGHPLRERAGEILAKNDRRLGKDWQKQPNDEILARAISIAEQESPQVRARLNVLRQLEDRDTARADARAESMARKIEAKIASKHTV